MLKKTINKSPRSGHLRAYFQSNLKECGTDEAGRGCLAGPVTAAAIIFSKGFTNFQINDSKQLTHVKRSSIREIIEKEALTFAIAHIYPEQIDKVNILNASIAAMHEAIKTLQTQPELILVDGNRFKPLDAIPYHCIVKGDSKYLSIAAASILAKTERDRYMLKLHEEHPQYGWNQNKGYPTKAHREAIAKYGTTPYHRKSFRLLKKTE
ncbi:MAG: ribonuclease HII [Leeuwenhoekiella sp.]